MKTGVVIATLVVYQLVLLGIGWWASRRNIDSSDFYLGGRRLGPAVAALSASASSSSAWSLLGVSGAAYLWGLPALWLIPSTLLGFVINWAWVAPRLHAANARAGALTLTEFLAGRRGDPARRTILRLGAAIVLFSFTFYVAAQFQAAGNTFSAVLGLDAAVAVLVGAAVVMAYVWLGGFWAASVTDSIQGVLMAVSAVVLPVAAIGAVGGFEPLAAMLGESDVPAVTTWTGQSTLLAAIGFVIGLLGIGLGYPGQPHVVNRFMAIEKASDIPRARAMAIGWAVVIYVGMVVLGWCGRLLVTDAADGEQVLFTLAGVLLTPVLAGVTISAILSAIMSTADSQLLVAASSVSHDLAEGNDTTAAGLRAARWVVLAVGIVAAILAIWAPDQIFTRVLFAWQALAAAFGPLLFVTLLRGPVAPRWRIAAMATGFVLTVVLSWTVDSPGDWVERYVPMGMALGFALIGTRQPGSR